MQGHDTSTLVEPKAPATNPASRHLIVLQHGLWGQAVNMAFLEQLLQERTKELDTPSVVMNSHVNEKYHTYEGIDACGERLTDLVVAKLNEAAADGKPFTHLSLVGYSMGGLMVRYAAGKLHSLGLLAGNPSVTVHQQNSTAAAETAGSNGTAMDVSDIRNGPSKAQAAAARQDAALANRQDASKGEGAQNPAAPPVQPVNFVTIATPHLGSWALPTSFWQKLFNKLVPQMAARSGTQLMLLDQHALDRPLLINMADPNLPFMQALAAFPHRTLLANTVHDRSVPYCTAAISETNPYESSVGVPIDPKYPSIVQPAPKPKERSICSKSDRNSKPSPISPPSSPGAAPAHTRSLHQSAAATQQTGLLSDAQVTEAISFAARATAAADGGDSDMGDLDPEQAVDSATASAATKEGFTSRKGWGVRLAVVSLLPLSLPLGIGMLSYMVMVGRRQWTAILSRTFDHSWVEKYHQSRAANTTALDGSTTDDSALPPEADASLGSQPSMSRRPSHNRMMQLTGRAMHVPEAELHTLSLRRSQELTDEDVDVSIDEGTKSFHVHQGLVDTPNSRERHLQLWMLKNLNSLRWKKVDVDTRHYHAHAAIMMRHPKRFADNADCLRYLVDSMVLQGLAMSA